jgi:hypothetical protein
MAPLQKEIYRSVLSTSLVGLQSLSPNPYAGKNLNILKSLTQPTNAKINTTTSKLNNMLMQLRK